MSVGHTPGPWEWDIYARGYVLVGAPPKHSSVRRPVVISHASADGRLIAAAPELLEAGAKLVDWWEAKIHAELASHKDFPWAENAEWAEFRAMRAAIAKARRQ